jgi:hypothetical protein
MKYLSIKKASVYFSLSEKTIRNKISTGQWPSYKLDGKRLINIYEIEKMMIRQKTNKEYLQ